MPISTLEDDALDDDTGEDDPEADDLPTRDTAAAEPEAEGGAVMRAV